MVVSPQSHSLFPDPTSGLFVYGERKITDEKYIINCFTVPSSYSEADSNYYMKTQSESQVNSKTNNILFHFVISK